MQKYITVTTKIYNNRTYHTFRISSLPWKTHSIIIENINTKDSKFYAKYTLKWQLEDHLNWNETRPSHATWHKGFQDSEDTSVYFFVCKELCYEKCLLNIFYWDTIWTKNTYLLEYKLKWDKK